MQEPAQPNPKRPRAELRHIELQKAENGGVIAQHRMNYFDGKEPVHAFGADEGHKLAAHIEKHLGIKMEGKSPSEDTEPEENDGD
jgi:hypothetical protein